LPTVYMIYCSKTCVCA